MPEEEEGYELLPAAEFARLKREFEAIKKNPLGAYGGTELIESINNLSKSINALLGLFKAAAEELKLEEREAETIGKKIEPLFAKIDEIVEQNRKIAKGIVSIADMLAELRGAAVPAAAPAPPAPPAPPLPPPPRPPAPPAPRAPPAPPAPPAPARPVIPGLTAMPPPRTPGLPPLVPPPAVRPTPAPGALPAGPPTAPPAEERRRRRLFGR